MFFHKNGGENFGVTTYMSHFSMLAPTKANVKLADEKTGHAQGIGIIFCCFTHLPILYPVGPIYYCLDHPSNNISLGDIKCYVGLKKVTYEPI